MNGPQEISAGETGGREVMRPARCRCYVATTMEPPMTLSAAEQARRNLRLSTRWTRFGRLLVEQLLAEHDAAVKRAEAAERALEEMRGRIGEAIDPDDVFEPGHTYRSENGYFEFHCEQRIGKYALGIETVLKHWPIPPGTRFRRWASIGPSVGYIDVSSEGEVADDA